MASVRTAVWESATGANRAPSLAGELADLIRMFHTLIEDPYRPELHYMRGPGPKWHAKHDPAPATINAPAVSSLVRVNACTTSFNPDWRGPLRA
jgi:hypothetical protein